MAPDPRSNSHRRGPVTPWTVAAAVASVGLAFSLALMVDGDVPRAADPVPAMVRTGERNAMGMPVIETPGAATGAATAGPVEVGAANWSLGTVPLNTAVRPTWVLRNTGAEAVTIGEPHPEVRQGCCPGRFTIGSRTIPAGGATTLTFELSMHPGMDGWHDIAVHVPVTSGSTQHALTLSVTGDFRDS